MKMGMVVEPTSKGVLDDDNVQAHTISTQRTVLKHSRAERG
jgi:hypothetical protein